MNEAAKMVNATIVYVIDPPGLILDSIYLLSSIRATLPDVPVIAYCPAHKMKALPPFIVELHNRLNARIEPIETNDAFSPEYRHGNKILACKSERDDDYTIFLDTDIIFAKSFDLGALCQEGKISVSPEGVMTWGKPEGSWELVYSIFDLEIPETRVELSRSGKLSLPYFNAGVVAFPNSSKFAQKWFDVANVVDAHPGVENKRPWLDQISLPIAAKLSSLQFNVLPREMNFSLSRSQKDPAKEQRVMDGMNSSDPTILHYHAPKFFSGTKFGALADDYIKKFTFFDGHEDLLARFSLSTRKLWEVRDEITEKKQIEDKSQEDVAHLAKLMKIRDEIKSGAYDPFSDWPTSIA